MKRKMIPTNSSKKLGKSPTGDAPIFSPELKAEIDRLATQESDELFTLAFSRLQQIRTGQQAQVDRNNKIESWRARNQNRYIKIGVGVGGVATIGLIADKPELLSVGLLGALANVGLHAKWVCAQAVGFDYVPFKGAEQRVEYLDAILQSHPGQPQTGTEQQP